MGKTYGVYISDPLDDILSIEIVTRRALRKNSRVQSVPKLMTACVQFCARNKLLSEVELIT